jgi:hypothetical protein
MMNAHAKTSSTKPLPSQLGSKKKKKKSANSGMETKLEKRSK